MRDRSYLSGFETTVEEMAVMQGNLLQIGFHKDCGMYHINILAGFLTFFVQ